MNSIAEIAALKNGKSLLTEDEIDAVAGACPLPLGGYWTMEMRETGSGDSQVFGSIDGNLDDNMVWDPCESGDPVS